MDALDAVLSQAADVGADGLLAETVPEHPGKVGRLHVRVVRVDVPDVDLWLSESGMLMVAEASDA